MIDLWEDRDEERSEWIAARLDGLCKTPLEKFMDGASEVLVNGSPVAARICRYQNSVFFLLDSLDGIPSQVTVYGVPMMVDFAEVVKLRGIGTVLAARFTEREFSGRGSKLM